MMLWFVHYGVRIGFAAALTILPVVAFIAYRTSAGFSDASGWTTHTVDALFAIEALERHLDESQAARRGYALTGDASHLKRHDEATARIHPALDELRRLTQDNVAQQKRLAALQPAVGRLLSLQKELVAIVQTQPRDSKDARDLTIRATEAMDAVHAAVAELQQEERSLLSRRQAEADEASQANVRVVVGGLAAAFLLVAVAGWAIDREIARRKRLEAALEVTRESERESARFFEMSSDMFCVADFNGRFTRVNAAFERVLGHSAAEMISRPFIEFVHPEDRHATAAEAAKLAGGAETANFVNRYRCRDGSYRWIEWVSKPSMDRRCIYAAARDITERKAAERALLEAREAADEANRAKSEFLSRMSHELRTPLNAILGFSQLLEMDNLTADQRESVQQISRGGRHLLDLINEVLDIARIESGRMRLSLEPVCVGEVLRSAVTLIRPVAGETGVQLVCVEDPLWGRFVFADLQRLKQVVLNLLSNAVKYNRIGGTATVSCREAPGGRLQIRVSDTGAGIHPEDLPRLFTPFDRLDREQAGVEGTGLGLALSKRLAEAMNGTLAAESVVGQGSTFSIELPLTEAPARPAARAEAAPEAAAEPRNGRSVLYIEDNLSNLRLVERVLAGRPSVRLVSAMQGRLGLDLARRHAPDLIFLDLHLPDMHGSEVLRRLQEEERTREIPVVVVSADATPSQIDRLTRAGARGYMTKPIDLAKFLGIVDGLPDAAPRDPLHA